MYKQPLNHTQWTLIAPAITDYEARMQIFVAQLESYVAARADEDAAIDVASLFYWFAWDVCDSFMPVLTYAL